MRALFAAALLGALPLAAQPADSLARPAPPAGLEAPTDSGRSPRGAVVRALLLPGLGQVYNRQPVKAPVATALVAGAAVYFADRQRQYVFYRRAAAVAGCLVDDGRPAAPGDAIDPERLAFCADAVERYADEYAEVNAGRATPFSFDQLRSVRSQARGQRDVGAVVVLAAYALQALDAYVSAELAGFDVSEDLSIGLDPTAGPTGLAVRVRL